MRKITKKALFVGIFVFAVILGSSSNVNAAYDHSVLKSYNFDLNTVIGTIGKNFNEKYINVASDARLYNSTQKPVSTGWNYVRYEVVNYYKNADMNW